MKKTKPECKFENIDTVGDKIQALVRYFAGETLAEFTLEMALEKVKEVNERMDEYRETIIEDLRIGKQKEAKTQ